MKYNNSQSCDMPSYLLIKNCPPIYQKPVGPKNSMTKKVFPDKTQGLSYDFPDSLIGRKNPLISSYTVKNPYLEEGYM